MDDKEEVVSALRDFKCASLRLLDVWNKEKGDDILNSIESMKKYPFNNSFENVVVCISDWVRNLEDSIR